MMITLLFAYWKQQPAFGKLYLLAIAVITSTSVTQMAKVALRLKARANAPAAANERSKDSVGPERLARYAMTHTLDRAIQWPVHGYCQRLSDGSSSNDVRVALEEADASFFFKWESYRGDIRLSRQLIFTSLLLWIGAAAVHACYTYEYLLSARYRTVSPAFEPALLQSFAVFGIGATFCALLLVAASFLERTLTARRTAWRYFSRTKGKGDTLG